GPLGGGIDYFSHCDRRGVHDLWDGDAEPHQVGYVTDLITDRAVAFIERRRAPAAPFLLSVHYTAPHWPWETRADEAESRRIGSAIHHVDGGSIEIYRAMIQHMDEGIRRILDALSAPGAAPGTLVGFTRDHRPERFSDSWPFVGKKMDLLEGGIRVPLIARWPAVIRPRGVTAQVAITMDWVATFLAAAGVAPDADHPLDGMSLLPALADAAMAVPRELFWRMKHRQQRAVRSGSWKYLSMDGHEYLFDLSRDARERANLARRYPEKLETLRARYAAWASTMPPVPDDAGVSLVYGD